MIKFNNLERVLQEYGNEVQELYKLKLHNADAKASGDLINSVKYIYEHKGNAYEVSLSLLEYWKNVEYGRKPNEKPEPLFDDIKRWIKIKPIIPRPKYGYLPTINQLTRWIINKINKEGIPPKNILEKTLETVNREYEDKISEALTLDLADAMKEVFALIVTR